MNSTLLVSARQGNAAATTEVLGALRPRLARMAAWYAHRCPEDADDLLQEAWLGVLEALPALDLRIGDPVQYLIQYARWRLLDAVKRSCRRRPEPTLDDEGLALACCPATDDETLASCDLFGFLRQLTRIQRGVLACLLAGLTWRETGEALGCSSANVAYHVRRIREQYGEWRAAL
ncbi:MAG: RNA polymerase sigma factor [Armatimonadota bacterium]